MARQTPCRLHRRPSSGTGSCRPQHVHDSASSFEFFPPQTEATTAAPRLRSPVPLSSFAAHIRRSQCNHNSFAEPHRHRQTPHHKTPPQPGRSPQRSPQPHQSRSQSASPALLRTTITDDPPANPIPARSTRLEQYAKPPCASRHTRPTCTRADAPRCAVVTFRAPFVPCRHTSANVCTNSRSAHHLPIWMSQSVLTTRRREQAARGASLCHFESSFATVPTCGCCWF